MRGAAIAIAAAIVAGQTGSPLRADPPPRTPRLPVASNEQAWKSLPRPNPPLPIWARMLTEPLPQTTGAMLELDNVHRAKNPLGPVLAGKLRWAAADAIGCPYARRNAEADLRRAGLPEQDLKALAGDARELSKIDRLAVGFARQMTRAAYEITDDEFAAVLEQFGPERTVAMVHSLAYANFQNRIFLALGIDEEPGGPLPPIDVPLDGKARATLGAPERRLPDAKPGGSSAAANSATAIAHPNWANREPVDVTRSLSNQQSRRSRIPFPEDLPRTAVTPPGATEPPAKPSATEPGGKAPPSKIVWTRISRGYQPLMTNAWFDCMNTCQREAKLDRVFANSVFWVVTRSNECFY